MERVDQSPSGLSEEERMNVQLDLMSQWSWYLSPEVDDEDVPVFNLTITYYGDMWEHDFYHYPTLSEVEALLEEAKHDAA